MVVNTMRESARIHIERRRPYVSIHNPNALKCQTQRPLPIHLMKKQIELADKVSKLKINDTGQNEYRMTHWPGVYMNI